MKNLAIPHSPSPIWTTPGSSSSFLLPHPPPPTLTLTLALALTLKLSHSHLHSHTHSHSHSIGSITSLAPQWGSAVHFGGAKIRARIALPFGAVHSNTCSHKLCLSVAGAEFIDIITLLAPQWGSAVHFGGPEIRARIALPFRSCPLKHVFP